MFDFFELGMWAIIAIAFMSAIALLVMHWLAQRSQNHINETSHSALHSLHSLGINAIIAANEMKIVDHSLEDKRHTNNSP